MWRNPESKSTITHPTNAVRPTCQQNFIQYLTVDTFRVRYATSVVSQALIDISTPLRVSLSIIEVHTVHLITLQASRTATAVIPGYRVGTLCPCVARPCQLTFIHVTTVRTVSSVSFWTLEIIIKKCMHFQGSLGFFEKIKLLLMNNYVQVSYADSGKLAILKLIILFEFIYRAATISIRWITTGNVFEAWPISTSGQSVALLAVSGISRWTTAAGVCISVLLTRYAREAWIGFAQVSPTIATVTQHSSWTRSATWTIRAGLTLHA